MPFCSSCGEIVKGTSSSKCTACGGKAKDSETSGLTGATNHGETYTNAYLSSGMRAGVEAGLRRAMGEEERPVNETCMECSKRLTIESDVFVGPAHAGGHVYCEGCYSKHFKKGDCVSCNKPVLGLGREYVMEGTRVWHKECYKGASCHECSKPIFGQAVSALDKNYHPDCFMCFNCRKKMGNEPFVDMGGEPCCKRCHEDIRATRSGAPKSTASAGKAATASGGNSLSGSKEGLAKPNASSYGEQVRDLSTRCDKCLEPVLNGDGVQLQSGAIFHNQCFCCGTCGKAITGGGKYVQEGTAVHHPECRVMVVVGGAGKNPTCAKCSKAISGGFVKTDDGKMLHSGCFTCSGCGTGLAGQPYGDSPDGPRCESCLRAHPSTRSGFVPGFTMENGVRKELRGPGGVKVGEAALISTKALHGLGTNDACPGCGKPAYSLERVPGPQATFWHKSCLKCGGCGAAVDSHARMNGSVLQCATCAIKSENSGRERAISGA